MLPSLPFEIQREIILAGVNFHDYIHPPDNIADIIEGRRVLSRACLVSKDWKDVALPLLYERVAFWDPDVDDRDLHLLKLFLQTISTSPPLALLVESLQTGVLSLVGSSDLLALSLHHLKNLNLLSRITWGFSFFRCPQEEVRALRLQSLEVESAYAQPLERIISKTTHLDLSELKTLVLRANDHVRAGSIVDPEIDPSRPADASSLASCFHPPVGTAMGLESDSHRLGLVDDIRIYHLPYIEDHFAVLASAVGPHLRTLHLAFTEEQEDFSQIPYLLSNFPNLRQYSLYPILDPEDDTNFLLFANGDQVTSSLELLLIGDPLEFSASFGSHPAVQTSSEHLHEIIVSSFDFPQLPALKAVGFWDLSFRREEDRESSHVAEGARLLASIGIELRDRLGDAWRKEWAIDEEDYSEEEEEEEGGGLDKELEDLTEDSRVHNDRVLKVI